MFPRLRVEISKWWKTYTGSVMIQPRICSYGVNFRSSIDLQFSCSKQVSFAAKSRITSFLFHPYLHHITTFASLQLFVPFTYFVSPVILIYTHIHTITTWEALYFVSSVISIYKHNNYLWRLSIDRRTLLKLILKTGVWVYGLDSSG
jgi:hypothetical protein